MEGNSLRLFSAGRRKNAKRKHVRRIHYIDGYPVQSEALNYVLDTPPSDLTRLDEGAKKGYEILMAARGNETVGE